MVIDSSCSLSFDFTHKQFWFGQSFHHRCWLTPTFQYSEAPSTLTMTSVGWALIWQFNDGNNICVQGKISGDKYKGAWNSPAACGRSWVWTRSWPASYTWVSLCWYSPGLYEFYHTFGLPHLPGWVSEPSWIGWTLDIGQIWFRFWKHSRSFH